MLNNEWRVVIPARLGSQGVRGKNYAIVRGKPLILHAIDSAKVARERGVGEIIVWTNDPIVRSIVRARHDPDDVEVRNRPPRFDRPDVTVDELCLDIWHEDQPTIMLQPTLYPSMAALDHVLATLESWGNRYGWYTLTYPAKGLFWHNRDLLSSRVNRQEQTNHVFQEVGLRVMHGAASPWKEIQWADPPDWVDIDTPADLERARNLFNFQKRIVFSLNADRKVGYGHLYRCMEVASELQDMKVFFEGRIDDHARRILEDQGWTVQAELIPTLVKPDVVVVDELDTTRARMGKWARARKIVTFENLGEGAQVADVVINDMYWNAGWQGFGKTGFEWTILRPEFRSLPYFQVQDELKKVLVTFGGTDPSYATERAWTQLRGIGLDVTIVPPPGRECDIEYGEGITVVRNPVMAELMLENDVVICSAGRTLLEAAAVGIPALVVTQNAREETHGALHRVGWYLGPAWTQPDFSGTLIKMTKQVRTELHLQTRGLIDGRGVERVANLIRGLAEGLM